MLYRGRAGLAEAAMALFGSSGEKPEYKILGRRCVGCLDHGYAGPDIAASLAYCIRRNNPDMKHAANQEKADDLSD